MYSIYDNKNIFLVLTYKCNAFCKKCMTRYHKNRKFEMSLSTFDYFIDFLARENFSGTVSMGTGEPLLYPYLSEVITRILDLNQSIHIRILTNGMALGNPLPEILFDNRCKIGVTFDAFEQEQLRGIQKGIILDTVKENISKLSQKYGGNHFYLNYTLYRHNLSQLLPFCQFGIENKIKEIYVTELKIFEKYESELESYRVIHDTEWETILSTAKSFLKENGVSERGIRISPTRDRYQCFTYNCASPIVDVDGSITFCSGQEDVYIGHISDFDICDKWSKFAQKIEEKSVWCKRCHDHVLANGTYSLPRTIQK